MPRGAIAIVGGTGHQGRGIAQRLAAAGRSVVVASRDPRRAADLIAAWPQGAGALSSASYAEAIAGADITVLAVPFDTVDRLLQEHRAAFKANTLVIDITVPLMFTGGTATLATVPEGSAAEYIRARLRPDVRLAATFKTVPAHLLAEIEQPLDCDEFVCGDSAEARSEAVTLLSAMRGVRAIDVGPLVRARSIEHLTLLAVAVNGRHKIRSARFRVVGL
jgi:NADPH-dependent F420 reductase